jgi:methyl-accepting chemotaxis protein
MSASITEISRQVQESNRIAGEAVNQAEVTDTRINELSKAALRIGDVVDLITSIAEQTNLLALNAVLEASRGGSGQSLDVLGAELRKLADYSRGAIRDIVTLLKSIQGESNDAVVVMEEANRTAETGARLTEHAGKAFAGISTLLRQTADLALTISGSSRQQAKDIDTAKATINAQAQAAQRNASRASDVLANTEQVTRICEQLNVVLSQFRSGPAMVKPEAKPEVQAEVNSAAAGD